MAHEREAYINSDPDTFYLRPPPPPHTFENFLTSDDELFQTIHMGAAVVDHQKWVLRIDGLVSTPVTIDLDQLKALPKTTITAFHECYGSPLKPPTNNLWRIGNVVWSGVRLRDLLSSTKPLALAKFVISEGLDRGKFGGVSSDRYQKDITLDKALSPEVLVAYEMNGAPLSKNRGGPVRLVVPGWYGTNSTKWLCKLSLQENRAQGPYTTTFYNEVDPRFTDGRMRPVWQVEPNSLIVTPKNGLVVTVPAVIVRGWAWSNDSLIRVIVTVEACTAASTAASQSDQKTSYDAKLQDRIDCSWQRFEVEVQLSPGTNNISACAVAKSNEKQPQTGRRNHVHQISVEFGEAKL